MKFSRLALLTTLAVVCCTPLSGSADKKNDVRLSFEVQYRDVDTGATGVIPGAKIVIRHTKKDHANQESYTLRKTANADGRATFKINHPCHFRVEVRVRDADGNLLEWKKLVEVPKDTVRVIRLTGHFPAAPTFQSDLPDEK